MVISGRPEPTEWVSQMVATRKNGDVRICLDPRDLNKALKRPYHPMRTAYDVAPDWVMRRSFQPWMQRLDFGRSSSKNNLVYVQRSVHHMGDTGFPACLLASTQHQKCSSKPWNDFLNDIHAKSLSTTSSSGVLLKKNIIPTSGKSWRELDRLA